MWINHYLARLRNLRATGRFGRLAIEITVILILKMLLLWLLWAICFSNPVPKESRQTAVTNLILNRPTP
ncbi:MAG: cytochrome oxidase putative small subunit CydP [Methylophilaceae bacterium]